MVKVIQIIQQIQSTQVLSFAYFKFTINLLSFFFKLLICYLKEMRKMFFRHLSLHKIHKYFYIYKKNYIQFRKKKRWKKEKTREKNFYDSKWAKIFALNAITIVTESTKCHNWDCFSIACHASACHFPAKWQAGHSAPPPDQQKNFFNEKICDYANNKRYCEACVLLMSKAF